MPHVRCHGAGSSQDDQHGEVRPYVGAPVLVLRSCVPRPVYVSGHYFYSFATLQVLQEMEVDGVSSKSYTNTSNMYRYAAAHSFAGVQFVTFLVIQLTSSVTLKVLGTARNAGLVVFSFLFLREVVTWLQGVGYVLSLVAFGFYNYFKMQTPAATSNIAPAAEESVRYMLCSLTFTEC